MSGVNWANVFWCRNGQGQTPGLSDLQAFLSDFGSKYWSAFGGFMHQGVNTVKVVGLYYGPSGGDLGTEATLTHTGSAAGAGLPNNASTCISWKVQQRYKGGHPRTYLPPPGGDSLADSRLWLTSHVSQIATNANNFHSQVNGMQHGQLSDIHLGTVSFVLRNDWRDPPVFRDFTLSAATVDQRIDTQRRRLGRDIL